MFSRIEINPSEKTYRVNRYPWERLSEVGDQMVLFGRRLSTQGAAQSIHTYAKRHGWKVKVRTIGLTAEGWTISFTRLA